jgi:hypothetical protein
MCHGAVPRRVPAVMANRQASFGELDEIRDLKGHSKAPAIFAASPAASMKCR